MSITSDIERAFHQESGRTIASLVRVVGDIDIAEGLVAFGWFLAVFRQDMAPSWAKRAE